MPHLLIVGQKFSSLTDYLISNGFDYTFLQDASKTKFPNKKFKRRILGDFTSKESVIASLDQLSRTVDGVIATYENYVLPASWIVNHLGLPGMPVAAAEACTDKTIMRSLFDGAPEKISPAFSTVPNKNHLIEFASSHAFPLILKPANLSKSLLVTKNHTMDELLTNYDKSIDLLATAYKKYAPNREPKLIVEEYLEGSIHSVDAFVDQNGKAYVLDHIVDYQTGYDIGYEDNFHYSRLLPSTLSKQDKAALLHCAEVGINALGMRSSPAHIEIIMTTNGPRVVEIGARNGGYRERMHWIANGIDITGAAIALSLGRVPIVAAVRSLPCAVLELFPKQPGAFEGIQNETSLRALPSLKYFNVKSSVGQFVGKSSDGFKMVAVAILSHHNPRQFSRDLQYMEQHVSIITR